MNDPFVLVLTAGLKRMMGHFCILMDLTRHPWDKSSTLSIITTPLRKEATPEHPLATEGGKHRYPEQMETTVCRWLRPPKRYFLWRPWLSQWVPELLPHWWSASSLDIAAAAVAIRTITHWWVLAFILFANNGILLPKLFWPTVRKKTFEIRGWRPRICKFFVKGQNNFW